MNLIQPSKETILKKVESYLNTYKIYDDFEKQYILSCIKNTDFPDIFSEETIREILDELNLIPHNYNIYEDYIRMIKDIHDIKHKNILEVGGGVLPRLGKRITLHQNKGNIIVYDPRLYKTDKTDKFISKREKVTENTNVNNIDLIIGLMPCKGAEDLVKLAIKNDKDFIVWLCEGGPHGDYYDFFEDENEWRSCLIETAEEGIKKNNMGKLMVKKMPKYSDNYPIIYNKRN